MKNKIRFLAMMLIGVLLSVNQVWGETKVWDFSTDDLSSKSPITLTYGQGSASNNTTIYNSTPKTLRLYPHRSSGNGSWIKFEASTGYEITAVSVTASNNQSYSRYGVDAENTGAALTNSFSFSNSVATISSLHATSFAIKNGQNTGSDNKTVALASITITYAATAPACAAPTSPTNGTTTKNNQVVSWTSSASAWDVYCSTSSTTPTTQTTATNLSSKPYTFTGLTPATKYYWWVRTNCGGGSTSSWVAGSSFTTSSITYTDYLTDCGPAVVWTVEGDFGEGWKDYDITNGQVAINNLAKNSSYDFKVHKEVGGSHDHYGATADDNKYTASSTNWTLNGAYNVHLKTAAQGTYIINVSNLTETYPQISVTYPTAYTITFDGHGNNGGSTAAMTNLAMGEVINLTANEFTKTCMDFAKWTTNQDGTGTEYTNGQSVTVSGNMTLYAQWTPKRYDAIYDANGVTGYTGELPATVTYNCGDQVTVSQTPRLSKFGYTFIGWNTNPAATTALPDNYQFTIDQGDTRIYAIWAATKPTGITIYPETGGNSPVKGTGVQMLVTLTPDASTMAEENREVTWSSNNTTYATVNQSGYVNFVGTGDVTITATSKVDGSIQGNYIFYVQAGSCVGWEISAYNSGEGNSTMDYFYQVGSSDEWRVKYVLPNGTRKFWVGNCDGFWKPEYGGHSKEWEFGWIRFKDRRDKGCGNNTQYPGQDAVGELVIWSDSEAENYGIAFLPNYKISYMTDGSNWRIMDFHSTSTQYSYETDIFQVPVGYKSNSDMKYYVGIEKNDGSNMLVNDGISSMDPMRDVNGLKDADMAGKYGKWHIYSNSCDNNWYCEFYRYYQVQFEMNGGDGNIDPMYFYASGTESFNTNTLTNPTKTGYELTGWKDQENHTYTTSESITVTKDLVLTAQWQARNYTITFDKNGGNADGGATATYDNGTLTAVTHVSRTGYDLNGYYTAASDGKMIVTAAGTLVANQSDYTDASGNWKKAENCTLYAQWTAKQYTVTLDNQEATTAGATEVTATYDAAMPSIAGNLPAKTGYDFGGYYDDIDGAGTQYYNNAGASARAWDKTAGATLYAKWTPSVYTISYKDQGGGDYSGSNLALLPTSHTYNTATNLVDGVKAGARFEGWYKNVGCTEGPVTTLGATEYTGNITLYAKWTAVYAITYTIPTGGGTLATGAQTSAASGETVTMPGLQGGNTVPAPYDCETLIGWTTNSDAYESKTGVMPDPFYAVGANSPAISGATTFYAVYSRPGAGAGGTGTISLTNTDMDNWYDSEKATDGHINYGVYRDFTLGGYTWATTGYQQPSSGHCYEIRLGKNNDVTKDGYIGLPTCPGNIRTITITANGVSGTYAQLAFRTAYNGTDIVTIQATEDRQTSFVLDLSSLSHTTGFIVNKNTMNAANITAINIDYGAPATISTTLNCKTDILSFEVTYDANTTEFPNATTTCTSPEEHTFNGDDPETNPYTICSDATCAGMTLVGWNSQADGQGGLNYTPGQVITSVGQDEFTLYAQFAYNVNVKDNDSWQMGVHPSERGGSIDLNGGNDVCDPIKYQFIGWTTDDPETWKQTITKPTIFSDEGVTTYTPTAVGTQVTAVYGMSTSVGSQAFYISYNDGSTVYYLKFNGESKSKTTVEAEATAMYRETIDASENKYHLYYMNNGVKTYFYCSSDLMVDDENPGASYGWVITTDGSGVSTFQSINKSTAYLSYGSSSFTTHTLLNKKPLTITTGAKEYKYYDETTCTDEITITFNAGGGTMDPVTTQIVGHTGTTITVPECSYPGWTWIGWVNTNAAAQTDSKIEDNKIYTNEEGHKYTIGAQSETLYAYYTKTPVPPTFDGNISDVWKIYTTTTDGGGNEVSHYESGSKDVTSATHGEYTTTTRCIEATDWAFTNVGTNQFTIQNLAGLYLSGDPDGDKNDIYFSADPSVWTMTDKGNGFYKFVNQNTLDRYLAFMVGNGAPTFINTSTANEGNSSYSYVKVGGCTAPVYTTSPGGEFKLNMLGNVRVTSTNNKTVRSVDALSISADNLTPNTAITLTDNLGVLAFCNATGGALNLTTDGTGKLANTAVYVKYTPTAYNTIETPTITATCGEQHQNFDGLVTGRSLPEKFIIAQKVGDDWYALPNNMSIISSQTNPAAVKISVVNEETGTATIYSDVTDHLAWTMDVTTQETNKNTLEFADAIGAKYLKVHTSDANTIGQYAKQKGADQQYTEFLPATSDLADYTLYNNAQSKYVGINSTVWGVYSDVATVRFFVIDQKVAPTLTWKNMMMSEDEQTHAITKAEDGLVVLPGEPNPVACERADAAGWEFDGWVTQQIIGNRTSNPTDIRVNSGESQTISKSYFALFTNNNGKWRTSCPTVNTITYKANGGEGTDYVQYVEGATATAVSVAEAGFSKEGSLFVGWTKDGDETGALIQPDATISGISGDIIINAVWLGELTISGDVRLTSAVGQKVATAATGITFSSTDMSCATALRITYRDKTNGIDYDRSTYTSSEFRLCNNSYNVADDGNISLAGVTGAYEQTYSISYTPNDGVNTLDHYTMKVEVLHSLTVIATVTKDLYGRTLPEKFAIVAHVGDMWYALPNNMASSDTYAPVAVSVNNSDASILNWTATGAKTAGYSMKAMAADYNKLRFASKFDANEYCLWASEKGRTGIRNWSATETGVNYRWTVTPQDANFQAYTLLNNNNGRTLRLDGTLTWGMYASGGTNVVYFIPLTDMEVADFQVIEWFANKVLIETNNQAINTNAAKTSVGSGEYTDATVNGTTYGTNQYTLTTGDLTTSAGKSLNIQYKTTAGDAWYMNSVKVPIIVSRGTYTTSESVLGGLDKSKYQDNDLVVRDGATLTVDAATGTWNTFKNVTIYPTSKVVVPARSSDDTKDVTMETTTMTLFGGIDEIYNGSAYNMTTYAVPQLVLKGNLTHSATVQGLRYDIRLNKAIYYDLALPYESKYELVTDNKGGEEFTFWTKIYDGAARAVGGNDWAWYDWSTEPWKIKVGVGYLFAAKPYAGQNYIIIRHPMGYNEKENPNGHQSNTPEATKASVALFAHNSTYDNNAGWNFIANPFMANFQLDQDGEAEGTIQTGELKEHKVNEKWDGHYEWDTSEGKDVRYVTTYDYATGHYSQHKMSETTLPPFTGFFVQVAKDGSIVFDISGRANAAPARMLSEDELPREMEITLKVNGQNESDETVMLLTKDLSRSNAREFPDEQTKMVNDGVLNYYTYGGEDTKMYANGMSYEEGQEWNKAGIMVKTAGEYSFSVDGVNKNYVEQVVLRDMDSNTEYDLMSNDAKIYLDKGEMNDRFYVKVVFGKHNIGTGNGEMYDNRAPEKFILNDHMYIRANGVLFDGVGKRVK